MVLKSLVREWVCGRKNLTNQEQRRVKYVKMTLNMKLGSEGIFQ